MLSSLRFLRSVIVAGIVASFICTAGCEQNVDLAGVQRLAATIDGSSAAFAALAADFGDSCVRQYDWQRAAGNVSSDPAHALETLCGPASETAAEWEAGNRVVLGYVKVLGSLAGGGQAPTDYGIPELLKSQHLAGAQSTSTIGALGAKLVGDFFDVRRRHEIAIDAPQAQSDLDALIAALESVAQDNYRSQLRYEGDAVDDFYAPVLRSGVLHHASTADTVALIEARERYRVDRSAVDERRNAIAAYVGALDGLKKTHAALVAAIVSNRPGDIGAIATAAVLEYVPNQRTLETALAPRGSKP